MSLRRRRKTCSGCYWVAPLCASPVHLSATFETQRPTHQASRCCTVLKARMATRSPGLRQADGQAHNMLNRCRQAPAGRRPRFIYSVLLSPLIRPHPIAWLCPVLSHLTPRRLSASAASFARRATCRQLLVSRALSSHRTLTTCREQAGDDAEQVCSQAESSDKGGARRGGEWNLQRGLRRRAAHLLFAMEALCVVQDGCDHQGLLLHQAAHGGGLPAGKGRRRRRAGWRRSEPWALDAGAGDRLGAPS